MIFTNQMNSLNGRRKYFPFDSLIVLDDAWSASYVKFLYTFYESKNFLRYILNKLGTYYEYFSQEHFQAKSTLFVLFSSERGLKQKDGESESHKQTLKTFRHESLKVIRVGGRRGGGGERLLSNAAHTRPTPQISV